MEPRSLIHTHTHRTHTESKTPGFMAFIYLPFMLQIQWRPMPHRVVEESKLWPHSPPGWMIFCLYTVGQKKMKGLTVRFGYLKFLWVSHRSFGGQRKKIILITDTVLLESLKAVFFNIFKMWRVLLKTFNSVQPVTDYLNLSFLA